MVSVLSLDLCFLRETKIKLMIQFCSTLKSVQSNKKSRGWTLWAHRLYLLLNCRQLVSAMQGRAKEQTAKNSSSGSPSHSDLQGKAEQIWALWVADYISSVVVPQIVSFLASKNPKEPATTAFGKGLLPHPRLHGLGLTLISSVRVCMYIYPTGSVSLENSNTPT